MAKKDTEQTIEEIKDENVVIDNVQNQELEEDIKEKTKKDRGLKNMNSKDTELFRIAEQTENNVIRVCNVHGGCIVQSITQIGEKLSESITFVPYVKFDEEFRQI